MQIGLTGLHNQVILSHLVSSLQWLQAKAIIDAIFAQTDYTYSADSFFNDNLFKQLYVDGIPFPSVTTIEEPALFEADFNRTRATTI